MSPATITVLVLACSISMFILNKVPAVAVALLTAVALFAFGILDLRQTLDGFGDPVVVFIACLMAIGAGLEITGVGTWAGQVLIRQAGEDTRWVIGGLMVFAALATALIGMTGTLATLLPVAVVVAVRTGILPSKIMLPVSFACVTGGKLTLLGTPVNMIAENAIEGFGKGIGFLEWSLLGVPLVVGTIAILWLWGDRLLPARMSHAIPGDFSQHGRTLVEHYGLDQGLYRLAVRASSPWVGLKRGDLDLSPYPGLFALGLQDGKTGLPVDRLRVEEGDILLVRGESDLIATLADDLQLRVRGDGPVGDVADTLFNAESGLAEVVIPPRSTMIGQSVFPGMVTRHGDMLVLAIQRGGTNLGPQPVAVEAGDHLLLKGTWRALDKQMVNPRVLVVDSPELVRRQAVVMGPGAFRAIAILALLVVLLMTNTVPPAIAGMICAALLLLSRVLTPAQFFQGIDWNIVIVIGAMTSLTTAMTLTGAAALVGDLVVQVFGSGGPRAVTAGLFLATAILTQFIANNSAAQIMIPVAASTALDLHVSPLPLILAVSMGASASFLTPGGTPVNLMVLGPGGYRFGDYWKPGLPVLLLSMAITVFWMPIFWPF